MGVWAVDTVCDRLVLRSDRGKRPPCLGGLGVNASPLLDFPQGQEGFLGTLWDPSPPDHTAHLL